MNHKTRVSRLESQHAAQAGSWKWFISLDGDAFEKAKGDNPSLALQWEQFTQKANGIMNYVLSPAPEPHAETVADLYKAKAAADPNNADLQRWARIGELAQIAQQRREAASHEQP